ncbi:NAD(P)-dependent alcohol dehydrogenase [Antrihabitans stalactiti]|uniref:NAD(P)-dependent alcohol dehydrogenase n=1 Tax=Antrihabitans stalactiti TaxID=2584121 RepID=A0A848KAF3_9NOCA|nr:NAD(P)-dependent alcohol dehydrogenase [Antrihabitans stalactiti]NMN95875.1 NAD(P)-dependent alcohol dehydrogenase [Antrihabitans stalactiti]
MEHSVEARAAVLRTADGPFELEDVLLDAPGHGQIVVRIAGVGVCHSDFLPRTPMAKPPIITGHEGAGVVEVVGDGSEGLQVGDHVVLSFDSCGTCRNCLDAQPAYCETFWPRNMSGYRPGRPTNVRDGAGEPIKGNWFGQSSFANLSVVAARNAIKVDPTLPLELLGPLSCGVLTGAGSVFNSLGVESGSSIAVFGAGTVGLSAIMAAQVAGATTIVAVDRNPDRLQLAEKLGATHSFEASTDNLAVAMKALVHGGLDYSLDTTGVPSVISTAIDILRLRGVCGCVGVQLKPLELRPDQLAFGRTIKGILEGDSVPKLLIPKLIALWQQGRFPFDELIQTFPLDQVNDAEQAMKSGAVVKPVLIPSQKDAQ